MTLVFAHRSTNHLSRCTSGASAGLLAAGLVALSACTGTDDAEQSAEESAASGEAETRSVTHAMGSTDVKENPQRVVVLDTVLLDASVALDVPPVGAALVVNTDQLPQYLGDAVDATQDVGSIEEPSLEQIAELEPDLILSAKTRHQELFDQLSTIAPTVFVESPGGDWKESVEVVGDALGVPEQAQQLLEDYDARAEEVRENYELEGSSAHVIRPREDDNIRLYGPETFTGDVLSDLGFVIPDQPWEDNGILELSSEYAGDLQADHILVSSDPSAPELPQWTSDLLEQTGSRIDHVDHETWIAGVGPLGAEQIIAELEQLLDG